MSAAVKTALLLPAFLLTATLSFAQTVKADYRGEPLNEVLIGVNDRFGAEISIDAALAAECRVVLQDSFQGLDELMLALAELCGLEVARINDVYTFRKPGITEGADVERDKYLFQGEILENGSGEPLAFTSLSMDGRMLIADPDGRFSFISHEPRRQLRFSHLGYGVLDTMVEHGNQLKILMEPGAINLQEVVISASTAAVVTGNGNEAGQVRLNDVTAKLIPGDNSNVLFNHLRLHPGILAAGENLSDYIIWGSYPGQNHFLFDGITLFNSYGIYDDVSRVNPLMVKNIEVYKGGYNVDIGDRVGGVVIIDGRSGNREKVSGIFSASNEMANAYLNLPMFKRSSSLQLAGRKSYYQWLNWNSVIDRRNNDRMIPSYEYGDLNLKFSGDLANNDRLEISAIASFDEYSEQLMKEGPTRYDRELDVSSVQLGSSFKYLRNWRTGGISTFQAAISSYESDLFSKISFRRDTAPQEVELYTDEWTNPINEFEIGMIHRFTDGSVQDLEFSLKYVRNEYEFDSRSGSLVDMEGHVDRMSGYALDNIQLARWFRVSLGLKADMPLSNPRLYLQPRVNGVVQIAGAWRLKFAWGLYNQFISKTPVFDNKGNRLIIWQAVDRSAIPVLSSMHQVFGFGYLSRRFEANIEGYYRTTDNISWFIANRDNGTGFFKLAESRTFGMDALLITRFGDHELQAGYTLSKVEEKPVAAAEYREAPHSQRHELKTSLVLNFSPVRISIANVYGSGFTRRNVDGERIPGKSYNRLDIAMQYAFEVGAARLETGLAILNLLNRDNIRLNRFASFPDGTVASTSAIPFTPSVYLRLGF